MGRAVQKMVCLCSGAVRCATIVTADVVPLTCLGPIIRPCIRKASCVHTHNQALQLSARVLASSFRGWSNVFVWSFVDQRSAWVPRLLLLFVQYEVVYQ